MRIVAPKKPTLYVEKRVKALADEHGWDREHVKKLVAVGAAKPKKRTKKARK